MLLVVGVADAAVAASTSTRLFTAAAGLGGDDPACFFLWDDITDDGPTHAASATRLRFDIFSLFITITHLRLRCCVALVTDDYLRREGLDGPRSTPSICWPPSAAS